MKDGNSGLSGRTFGRGDVLYKGKGRLMKKIFRFFLAWCCVAAFVYSTVYGASLASVMNVYTSEEEVILFLKNQEKEIETVYVGGEEAKRFRTEEMGPVRTIVLLDNSLSIKEKYRASIKTFLTDLAAARNTGDTFTIATYAEQTTYLTEESSDYLNIKAQIDGIQFINQESYFTNALYTVLEELDQYDEIKYTRIIVIADGIDNEALGYTDEELNGRIRDAGVPIYTLGCTSKGNEENLKRMFSLSRLSNGKSYLMDEVSESEILKEIESDLDIVKVVVVPQDKVCDGTSQSVRISFGEDYCTAQAVMPFKARETVRETEKKETVPEKTTAVQETKKETEPETSGSLRWNKKTSMLIAAGASVLAVLIILPIVIIKRKKTEKSGFSDSEFDIPSAKNKELEKKRPNGDTKIMNDSSDESTGQTDILGVNRQVRLLLKDMDNPSKTFEYPIRDKIRIGRNASKCQVVIDYDKYISAIHCEIIVKGDGLYVRDGGGDVIASTNGTFVNGKRVAPELPLPSGSVLKLGQVRLAVSYK